MAQESALLSGITLSLASIGAVLGVINTWKALDRDKVKLKVIPKQAFPVGGLDERPRLCIEVINLSTFPVTINEVGFNYKNKENLRWAITKPIFYDEKILPYRLEPRTSLTAYCSPEAFDKKISVLIKNAYATTDCRKTITGKSGALKQFIKMF